MKKKPQLDPTAPLLYDDHEKPKTRRDFLSAGLISGVGLTIAPGLLSMLSSKAYGQTQCSGGGSATSSVPFLCFDMSGGANIAGSNVLVGKQGGQLDFLSTAGYSKLGLPSDMTPDKAGQIDTSLGIAFHSDSAILRGIKDKASTATMNGMNGTIICARSANDTGNNPHNPMYGIAKAGGEGSIVNLIGTSSSTSGGRSASPATMINPEFTPTKVDRPSDARGLVDTGVLSELLSPADANKVLKAMENISANKVGKMNEQQMIKEMVNCGYIQASQLAAAATPDDLDPLQDPNVTSIFSAGEINSGDTRYRKTASVMKLVIDGRAGAGTIEVGGYDYHDSTRATGEIRDFRMGQQIGGAMEYAQKTGNPLMVYVFSDGSVASDGVLDNSTNGRGKGIWKGDNSSTASVLILVYKPGNSGRPTVLSGKQQIGFFSAAGAVDVTANAIANNVNSLAHAIVLNFMALHGTQGQFASLFPDHGLGNNLDQYIAFDQLI